MKKMTLEEMEDFVMLEEMRASKDEPTVTYEEFLKIVGWKKISYKNQSKSNAPINNFRK